MITSTPQRPLRPAEVPGWDPTVSYARLDPIVDVVRLQQLMRFPFGALRRRRLIASSAFACVLVVTLLAALFLPRTYFVQSRILARRNVVMPALGNPRRTVPGESDAPTRMATEAVMSRENLVNIIQSAKLLDDWNLIISPAGRVRQYLRQAINGPISDADKIDGLVGMLERYMWVAANEGNEGTVSIGVGWRDPHGALRIVQAAQQNFLERRYASEVTLIGESISILERYVASARQAIEESMAESRPAGAPAGALLPAGPVRPSAASRARSEEITGLQSELRAKQTAISDLENARSQRVSELQSRLMELKNTYGAAHPEIATVQQNLLTLNAESPQLVSLRADARSLGDRIKALGGVASVLATGAEPEAGVTRETIERWMGSRSDSLDNPRVTYARSRLKIAITNYEDLLDRLEGARIELETARAAFKYRYTILSPPQLPKDALSPNIKFLAIVGVALAVLLAIFVATALDLMSGRIVESWQVDRQLGLPVLGEVR